MSDEFREEKYLRVDEIFGGDAKKGFCYSEKEIKPTKDLLFSVSDDTIVNIVRGMDEICQICTSEYKNEKNSRCKNVDPLRSCYKLLGDAKPGRELTIGFLKGRYKIYKKFGSIKKWKNRKKRRKNETTRYSDY